jgi:hypothetical protein
MKRTFLPKNHDLYQIQYRGLPSDAINPLEALPALSKPTILSTYPPAGFARLKSSMSKAEYQAELPRDAGTRLRGCGRSGWLATPSIRRRRPRSGRARRNTGNQDLGIRAG